MKILITRPIRQSKELVNQLANLNHELIISPLLEINYIPDVDLQDLQQFDGIIITSQNALYPILAYEMISKIKKVFIVGRKSSELAKSSGFREVIYAGNNVKDLKKIISKEDRLLYLSGSDVKDGFIEFSNVQRRVIYNSDKVESIDEDFLKFFKDEDIKIITLFSFRMAENLLYLVNKYGLEKYCINIILLVLSSNIAKPFKASKFKACYVADSPELESLIKLIDRVLNAK